MLSKNFRKKMLRKIGLVILVVTHQIIRILPEPIFKLFKTGLIMLGRPFIAKKKKVALENLNMVFKKTKSAKEIDYMAQYCFDSAASDMIELLYYADRPDKVMAHVSIEGKEHLDKALKAGQGAIMMSAHFGNFVLMLLRMVMAGYETNCMTRATRDKDFEQYITNLRNKGGFRTIYTVPRKRCVLESLKSLKRNELLYILFDQNYGDDGQVFVDFFGRKASTATGPVILSQRSGAPVLPVFIIKEGNGDYIIKIEKPVTFKFEQGDHMELVNNVAKLTKVIEKYVTLYPDQWGGWMHRRWKTKPIPGRIYEELNDQS